jgi:hypothetical protein
MLVLRWGLSCALLTCAACSLEPAASGDSCTRSSQCKPGLACVFPTGDGNAKEGRCSADLTSLYDPSQVPMLTPDAGAVMLDAGPMMMPMMMMPPDPADASAVVDASAVADAG